MKQNYGRREGKKIKKLERAAVKFISVSESFDTTKPMGRAMMNITSAFAELERNTITERIATAFAAGTASAFPTYFFQRFQALLDTNTHKL